MKTPQIHLTLSALLVAALTACGGGSGGGTSDTSSNTASPVATAASNNLTALSATAISSDSNSEAFDVLASIGDTWRLVVNKTTGAYTLTPNNSQYALAAESGTLSRTVVGDVVTYTLANKVSLTQDTRTGALLGSMTVGGQAAQVSGTPYQVADASKLAGIYNFIGTTRDKVGGTNSEFYAGQLSISSNGASATLCVGGGVDSSGNCTVVDSSGQAPEKGVLAVSKVSGSNGGFYKLTITGGDNQTHDFGNLLVQNGNLGTVLLIDRYGNGDSGLSNTVRVGNFYAVKAQTLQGNELNGGWTCPVGNATATLAINGNTNAVTNPAETPSSWTETLSYNKVNASNGALLTFPGMVVSTFNGSGVLALPLSASVLAVERDGARSVTLCSKK